MGFFSSVAHVLHPASSALGIGKKSHRPGAKFLGRLANKERQAQLDATMKEYEALPTTINDAYTNSAKTAGTFANTPEFMAGLQSEVDAGVRGARVAEAARINALRKAMDNKFKGSMEYEEFKPEGLGETDANATHEALQNPAPAAEPEPTAPAVDTAAPKPPTASTSVQSGGANPRITAIKNKLQSFASRFSPIAPKAPVNRGFIK